MGLDRVGTLTKMIIGVPCCGLGTKTGSSYSLVHSSQPLPL